MTEDFSKLPPITPAFYLEETELVARNLLGKALVMNGKQGLLAGEIVEVEAYLGKNDPASHAYRGKTKRNWAMFEQGGSCYVYLSYGVHYCMNVSTREAGMGEAVLLRALAPLYGDVQMRRNRKAKRQYEITNGPGKLTQAFRIDLSYNGLRFDRDDFKLVDLGRKLKRGELGSSPRIGISKAKERLLRFYIKTSPWISRKD